MRNILFCAGLLAIASVGCKHADEVPAQTVEGIYQAKDYAHFTSTPTAYPISGQDLILQISYVATDTVRVDIRPSTLMPTGPLPDGVYSPTQTLSYPKAYIEPNANGASYIYLTGKPASSTSYADNQIWIYSGGQNADYIFTPKQTPTISTTIRFEKR